MPQHEHSFAHEQPDHEASLKSPPPSHTHTTITAALAPDPSFSEHIQGRDLVTCKRSHSAFRNTLLKLLQRRIIGLKSDSKANQDTLSSPSCSPLMPVPTKPHSEAWPSVITVNTTGGLWEAETFTSLKRHSKSCSCWEICWANSLAGLLVQICKFKGWHKVVIKTGNSSSRISEGGIPPEPNQLENRRHTNPRNWKSGKVGKEIRDPHVPTSFMSQQLVKDASEVT